MSSFPRAFALGGPGVARGRDACAGREPQPDNAYRVKATPKNIEKLAMADWAVGNVGTFVDDIEVTLGGAHDSFTSLESESTAPRAAGPSPDGTPNPTRSGSARSALRGGAVIGMNGDSV